MRVCFFFVFQPMRFDQHDSVYVCEKCEGRPVPM